MNKNSGTEKPKKEQAQVRELEYSDGKRPQTKEIRIDRAQGLKLAKIIRKNLEEYYSEVGTPDRLSI